MAQEITGPIHDDASISGDHEPAVDRVSDGVLRTRIIPLVALAFVVAMIGLLAYSVFAPNNTRLGQNGRINESGALITELEGLVAQRQT